MPENFYTLHEMKYDPSSRITVSCSFEEMKLNAVYVIAASSTDFNLKRIVRIDENC